jgi:hypothetical protein
MYKIAFEPQKGGQSLALSCPCNEVLFEGTRGSMKTAAQLMKFRAYVGLGYGAFWKGVIFDVKYKNLGDIIAQSKKLFMRFNDGARFLSSPSELRWVWPTGEELLFRYEERAEGYWNYHGQEYPFIGHNELTKRPDDEFYEAMFSCMRTSFRPEDYPLPSGDLLPLIPLMCFSTTNPFGVGHSWVKKRFIDPVPRGTVNRIITKVPNPITDEDDDVLITRVAIHGTWKENKFLDPTYLAFLMNIRDPNKRKAWVDGSWDVTSGGRFDHLWNASVHVVKSFNIPKSWWVDRSHDWGESKPFSNLWFAEADGCSVDVNGKQWTPAKGSIICIGEYYGCEVDQINTGLKMSASNVAKVVKWVDSRLQGEDVPEPFEIRGELNIIPNSISTKVWAGPADTSIYNDNDEQISLADKMEKQGVLWEKADKRPGSRVAGASLLCEMLEAALEAKESESGIGERPALYFMEHCRGIISRFPILPRDSKNPEDIDTASEDHDYDAIRYRATSLTPKPSAAPRIRHF